MKEIKIDDFSGGYNTYDLQSLVADNQCVTGSQNVWAPLKALTKVPGYSTAYGTFSTGTINGTSFGSCGSIYVDPTVNSTMTFFMRLTVSGNYYPWIGDAGTDPSFNTLIGYNVGTVSISGANLISATGSGTLWTANVSANDLFRVAVPYRYSLVSSVEDNTHLTLSFPVTAAVATGSAYRISPNQSLQEAAWASLNGSWWSTTTAEVMQQFDGTNTYRISAAPSAAFLAVFKNYMFAGRTSTAQSRLYWSATKDPTSWPTNNFVDIDKGKGIMSGLFPFGNELIIFKSYGMYKFIGDNFDPSNPTYAVYPISVPKYFTFNSAAAVAIHRGLLYFYAYGQLYSYMQGTFFIQRVSEKFQRDLPDYYGAIGNRYSTTTLSDPSVQLISFNDNLLIKGIQFLSNATARGAIIDKNGAYWPVISADAANQAAFSPLGSVPFGILPGDATTKPRLIVTSNSSPSAMVWDFLGFPAYDTNFYTPNSAANAAISSTWISKEFNIEYGTFKHAVIYLAKQSAGNLTFSWTIDQGTYVDNTVDMTTGRGQVIRSTLNINQRGSTIQLKIVNNVVSQKFVVYGIKIFYEPIPENRQL